MGATQSDAETDVNTGTDPNDSVYEPPQGVVDRVRESVLLKMALGGVLFIIMGALFNTGLIVPAGGLWSIWGAIFATWGVGLILVGLGAYGFLSFKRR